MRALPVRWRRTRTYAVYTVLASEKVGSLADTMTNAANPSEFRCPDCGGRVFWHHAMALYLVNDRDGLRNHPAKRCTPPHLQPKEDAKA